MARPLTFRELSLRLQRLTKRDLPELGFRIHRESHLDLPGRIRRRIPIGETGRSAAGFRDLGGPGRVGEVTRMEWTVPGSTGFDVAVHWLEPGLRPRKETRRRADGSVRRAGVLIGSPKARRGVFGPVVRGFRGRPLRRIAERELERSERKAES